jgi:pimeloyl-ACP methyl ester carboxylesterase
MRKLVLIPGLLCDRRLWESQAAALSARANIYIPRITVQTTVTEMASAVLQSVDGRFSLAGFSLGSQVALRLVELAPDRVERLALLSATHGGLPPPVREALRNAIIGIEQGGFVTYLESAFPGYVTSAHAEDARIRRCFMEMAHTVGPTSGVLQMKALLDLKEPFCHLGQICCPTVVIGGSKDRRTTPADHERLASEIPNASLFLIEEAAHFTPLEQPIQVTTALLEWMSAR